MRRFLFLQGPHGPFFAQLGAALRAAGAEVRRVGFNAGDRAMWPGPGYVAHDGSDWSLALRRHLEGVTDLLLYGDTRPVHAAAIAAARARGLAVHVLEEGYLRPWWITYERGGANGASPLRDIGLAEMEAALDAADPGWREDGPEAPAHWGALRQHMFWGAAYHACLLLGGASLPSHRGIPVAREAWLHARRLALLPAVAGARRLAARRLRRSGAPCHLALLQLDHDASFRRHGPFATTPDFIARVTADFAAGAPPGDHLAFKAHPLEDGRLRLARVVRAAAERAGIAGRVHYLPGGPLAPLLDAACAAVTVNSTAAQQALRRGLPVLAYGDAVYSRPGLVSARTGPDFFAAPDPPDRAAYAVFRAFLLGTSQVPGAFYSAAGRRQLLATLPARLLETTDRTAALLARAEPRPGPRAAAG